MQFSFTRPGFVDGNPWIGRLLPSVSRCAVNLDTPANDRILYDAKLIFEDDLKFDLEEEEDLNISVLKSLGKAELKATEAKGVYLVIWASSSPAAIAEEHSNDEDDADSTLVVGGSVSIEQTEELRQFEAVFHLSRLGVDVDELFFGECFEKGTSVREFTIRNLSDSKLLYHVETYNYERDGAADDRELLLSFYDTGKEIKSGLVYELSGRSFVRLHATLRPQRPGVRVWMISIENDRNFRNVSEIFVRANVAPALEGNLTGLPPVGATPLPSVFEVFEPGHRPSGNFVCSFGDDCYVGNVVSKRLILKNISTTEMEITLSSPDSAHAGPVSMLDAVSVQLEILNQSSESETEDDVGSLKLRRSPVDGDRSIELHQPPENRRDSSSDEPRTDLLDDLHRPRSDTASSAIAHRSSFNSLTSPNISLSKRSELTSALAAAAANQREHSSGVRDRSRSHDSWGSMVRALAGANYLVQVPPSESVHIPPGEEREVYIYFMPLPPASQLPSVPSSTVVPASSSSEKAKKLFKHTFRLQFSYGTSVKHRQVKTVMAEARACVSFVTASPSVVKFGDCLLKQKKVATVTFQNHSELDAHMRLNVQSKQLHVEPSSFIIEPKGTFHAQITFIPQSVNPNYRKEILCTNLKNRDNSIVVNVQSTNVDLHNFAYHAYFYKLFAFDAAGQEADFTEWSTFFSPTLLDGLNARRIGFRNLTRHELSLSLKTSEEIQMYSYSSDEKAKEDIEKLVVSFERATYVRWKKRITPAGAGDDKRKEEDVVEAAERRLKSFDEFVSLSMLRKVSTITLAPDGMETLVVVFRPSAAKRTNVGGSLVFDGSNVLDIEMTKFFVEDVEALQNAVRWTFNQKDESRPDEGTMPAAMSYLMAAMGLTRKSSTSSIMTGTNSSITGSDRGGSSSQQPGTAASSALGDNTALATVVTPGGENPQQVSFPVRHVPLRATIARSCMKLSQTHFNFGTVDNAWERRGANVSLLNLSPIPLVFRIERGKQHLSAAGGTPSCIDIGEDSLSGVVPPFGNETLHLLFVPRTWRGRVVETIAVKNILDGSTLEIVVKADVMIPEHFRVEHTELDFGPCFPGTTTVVPGYLSLINTTKKTRELVVQVSLNQGRNWPKGHVPVFCFHLAPPQLGGSDASVTAQEQAEILEHQIRIATRKLDYDKVAMLNRKLATLQQQQQKDLQRTPNALGPAASRTRMAPIGPLKGSVLVSIPPLSFVRVTVWLHVRLMTSSAAYSGHVTHSGFRIFESKQGDQVVKQVPFSCTLYDNKQEYLKTMGSSPLGSGYGSPLFVAIGRQSASPERPQRLSLVSSDAFRSPDQQTNNSSAASTPMGADEVDQSLMLQTNLKKIRQIEVGAQSINQWFPFFVEVTCPGFTPATPRPPAPASTSDAAAGGGAVYSFRFLRVYFSDESKKNLELKLPQEEVTVTMAEGKKQVKFEARYMRGGRHLISLVIFRTNKRTKEEEREEVLIKGQASFLELDPPTLDFGNVVIVPDESTEREQPFTLQVPIRRAEVTVKNTHNEPVLVSAESNSNQVVVFAAGEEAAEQIDRVLLESNQSLKMCVSIKPSLLADAWIGACRMLRGGVVITCEVGSEDDRDLTHVAKFQSTVPFTGTVGMSVFTVSEQRTPGVIRVTNRSEKIPLRVEAKSDSDDVRFSPNQPFLEIPPASELDVIVRSLSGSSLTFRNVIFRNLDSGETLYLLKTACALSTNELLRIERGFGVRVAVPVRKKQKDFVVAHDAVSDEVVRVRNISDKRLKVTMRCGFVVGGDDLDPPLLFGTGITPIVAAKASPTSPTAKWRSNDLVSRAECVILPGIHRDVYFKYPKDSRLMLGSFKGWLTFETRSAGEECAAAVRFQGEASVSHFEIDRKRTDAGEMGALNRWNPRLVELVRLSNADPFVPADVQLSLVSPKEFLKILPVQPRYQVEPGAMEQIILGTIQVSESDYTAQFTSATEVEVMMKLSNALNVENEFSIPIKVRICPKIFLIERDNEEVGSTLTLPTVEAFPLPAPAPLAPNPSSTSTNAGSSSSGPSVAAGGSSSQASSTATSPPSTGNKEIESTSQQVQQQQASLPSVNEWVSVVNPSAVSEIALECLCTTSFPGEISLVMVYRSTGAPVPSVLRLKPSERVDVRLVLRCERGCSVRGDVAEFGKVTFTFLTTPGTTTTTPVATSGASVSSTSIEETKTIVVKGMVKGPPLLKLAPEKKWDVKIDQVFTPVLHNETKFPLRVSMTPSDPDMISIQNSPETDEQTVAFPLQIPPFGSVKVPLVGKKLGQVRVRFECLDLARASQQQQHAFADMEVLVDSNLSLQTLSSAVDDAAANIVMLPTTTGNAVSIAGGLGVLQSEVHQHLAAPTLRTSPVPVRKMYATAGMTCISGYTSFVCDPGLYEIDAGILSEPKSWTLNGISGDVVLVGSGVRSASEATWITMKRVSPEAVQLKLTPQYAGNTGGFFAAYMVVPGVALVRVKMEVVLRDSDEIATSASLSPSGQFGADALPFDLSPRAIASGPLYYGRLRSFPFTLFNRHPTIPLVFQLNVVGVKGGMQAWFSFVQGDEEHRRVTIMPSSTARLALNVIVPDEQTEDFSDLEINIACRHLRNTRMTLRVAVPERASKPTFSVRQTLCRVGDIINVSFTPEEEALSAGTSKPTIVVVGPDWVTCTTINAVRDDASPSPSHVLRSSGLIRTTLTPGESFRVDSAASPTTLTLYSIRDPHDQISIKVQAGPGYSVPIGGASLWRDAVELELTRACVLGEFVCPADIVFQEILQLLTRDPGGRGASLAALFFCLRFGGKDDEATKQMYALMLAELRGVPETSLLNPADL